MGRLRCSKGKNKFKIALWRCFPSQTTQYEPGPYWQSAKGQRNWGNRQRLPRQHEAKVLLTDYHLEQESQDEQPKLQFCRRLHYEVAAHWLEHKQLLPAATTALRHLKSATVYLIEWACSLTAQQHRESRIRRRRWDVMKWDRIYLRIKYINITQNCTSHFET